jgi:hypothetical protein
LEAVAPGRDAALVDAGYDPEACDGESCNNEHCVLRQVEDVAAVRVEDCRHGRAEEDDADGAERPEGLFARNRAGSHADKAYECRQNRPEEHGEAALGTAACPDQEDHQPAKCSRKDRPARYPGCVRDVPEALRRQPGWQASGRLAPAGRAARRRPISAGLGGGRLPRRGGWPGRTALCRRSAAPTLAATTSHEFIRLVPDAAPMAYRDPSMHTSRY